MKLLQKKRFSYDAVSSTAEASQNPKMANRIEVVTIHAYVKFHQEINAEQLVKLEELVIKNCSMIQTIIEAVDNQFKVIPTKEELA